MVRSFGLPLVAVAAFSYMAWHVASSSQATPQTEPVVEPSRAPFTEVVAGVGLIEPRSENIEVAAITPGTVVEVKALEGAQVAAGDVLFRLDDRQLQAELAVQKSLLAEAEATLGRWQQMPRQEDVPPSEARVKKFQADVELRRDQLHRTRTLVAKNAMAEQELVEREQAYQAAQAELTQSLAEDARLKAGAWKADVAVARAQVERMEAQVAQARVEIDRLAVRSPIAGRVLKVDVRPGEYVGTPPGKPLVVLGDVSKLHVRVDIDEQDLPRLEPGMPGEGFVRGDADHPLKLSFVRIEPFTEPKRSLTGFGNERIDTRVLQVIYAVESAPREVYVGQQIDVFLDKSKGRVETAATAR
ncbi:HlyD family secretion protein [Lacipirellula sp.]|uniref:HlyD family secretion protein n=1 Tax=Lacipirellula sp. TaxID=2691419 RepID=UPI003D149BB3